MSSDQNLLRKLLTDPQGRFVEAATHRTYAVENDLGFDNQRLEFLGDAVLEIILSDHLISAYPDAAEGELSQMRAALACEPALAALARKFDLGPALRIGRGEAESGGIRRDSTLADLFEAAAGACYLELGFEKTRELFLEIFRTEYPDPRRLLEKSNPKGLLQEYSQLRRETPHYAVLWIEGPPHHPSYVVEARVFGVAAVGRGRSRKQAEMAAAERLYRYFQTEKKR